MNYTDRHIVESYSGLFEGLNRKSKIELIERLSRSLDIEKKSKEDVFYSSFGAFPSQNLPKRLLKI